MQCRLWNRVTVTLTAVKGLESFVEGEEGTMHAVASECTCLHCCVCACCAVCSCRRTHNTGKRGLEALSHIHTPPNSRDSSATSSLPDAPQQAAGLWTPGSASLGVLQGSAGTQPNPHEVPGLILLQDMVVAGPQGVRNEQYSRPASRSKAQQGSSSGSAGTAVTPGIGEALPDKQVVCAAALSL